MAEKISSPGVERKEIYPSEPLITLWTLPWVYHEKLSCSTLAMKPPARTTLTNPRGQKLEETVSSFLRNNCRILSWNVFSISDRLQSGCSELAWDQWGDLQLSDWDGHLPHPHLRPGSLRRVRPPPRHLHLHHVLLLHEESHSSEPESEFLQRSHKILDIFIWAFRNLHWGTQQYLEDKRNENLQESQWIFFQENLPFYRL